MNAESLNLSGEFIFKAVRSSGKGGQNVNKVSSKIELYFNIPNSEKLNEKQKQILSEKLQHLMNDEGTIRIVSQEDRSQLKNKEIAISKFNTLISKALTPVKKRVKTKTPRGVKEKRIADKKVRSEVKSLRKKPESE